MNLPNKLTCLRVLLIPFFVLCMTLSLSFEPGAHDPGSAYQVLRIAAELIFIGASLTDYFDGHIARRDGLITDFGKFMDPLADKLLVCSALILFVAEGSLSAWIVIVIIAREFIISGFRLVASDRGIVIAASMWGKVKTVSQMALCLLLIPGRLLDLAGSPLIIALTALTLILTILSLIDYISRNKRVITEGGM